MSPPKERISIERSEVLDRLLSDSRVSLAASDEERRQATVSLARILEVRQGFDPNAQDTTRLLIRRRHLAVNAVMWETLTVALSFLPLVLGDPSPSVAVTTAVLIKGVFSITQKLRGLTDRELKVCHVVTEICESQRRRGKVLELQGATLGDIESRLAENSDDLWHDLKDVLSELTPNVLRRTTLSGITTYALVP